MGLFADIDGQFHRAVDIVQSLPKGGPVQTSYEEKLWLYSLYKQATEGDISIPRPGMLDILGKAKWDAWNKQKGIDKQEAKRSYVNALLKILRNHGESEGTQNHISELESFDTVTNQDPPPRPVSPASSSSSYHSSQASPIAQPSPPEYNMLPPDPLLPPPDVAENIVPPSALTSSHRSLLNLSQAGQSPSGTQSQPQRSYQDSIPPAHVGSRTHSLAGGQGSIHSFRQRQPVPAPNESNYLRNPVSNSNVQMPQYSHSPNLPAVKDFVQIHTPDISNSSYLNIQNPIPPTGHTPITNYPTRIAGPGSASTFNAAPLNLSVNLHNIQTSLSALHERLSILERNQSIILRKHANADRKRNGWFGWNGNSEGEDELDQLEEDELQNSASASASQHLRNPTAGSRGSNQITVTRVKVRRPKLTIRIILYLLLALRRAVVDLSVGLTLMVVCIVVLGGGWRRARWTLGLLQAKFQRYLTEGHI
ncbi:hypothetical protein L486_07624 [Kwoniella mangroviensis CBS 10435]|uniref:ACB domain-containing protein n=1 Tax=Kwoniella mangroviensis CBS 10435 TaxID=1331196 RepID=A0A1B9IH08_9TREE|nr:uncharacterized protein I203_03441 [Kwoniella mangroviensis CBS 8507]OCF54968.1 hypothetical protein L486_07624 [Kwoniella mangroviensis CBS 10435]OCF67743.1 hypothetical protein I203_03441 [Kwoniella mangroviensis CBS 8507]